ANGEFTLRRLADGAYKLRAASPQGPIELNRGASFHVSAAAPLVNLQLNLPGAEPPPPPPPPPPTRANRVLDLDGQGRHVQFPPGMFDGLKETTIEAWVQFGTLNNWQRFFSYGSYYRDLYVGNLPSRPDLNFGFNHRRVSDFRHNEANGVLETG